VLEVDGEKAVVQVSAYCPMVACLTICSVTFETGGDGSFIRRLS